MSCDFLEDALISDASRDITVRTRVNVALYILNQKRAHLTDIELRFGAAVTFDHDATLTGTTYCAIERGEAATGIAQPSRQIPIYAPEAEEIVDIEAEDETDPTDNEAEVDASQGRSRAEPREAREPREEAGDGRRKRRRRRGRDRVSSDISSDAPQPSDDALAFVTDINGVQQPVETEAASEAEQEDPEEGDGTPTDGRGARRRRSRRGGRRAREGRERRDETLGGEAEGSGAIVADGEASDHEAEPVTPTIAHEATEAALVVPEAPVAVHSEPASAEPSPASESPVEPLPVVAEVPAAEPVAAKPEPVSSELDPSRPKRSGWWQRAKASLGG